MCKCNVPISSPSSVFWPYVHPVGLSPRSEGFNDVTLAAKTHIPGAASAQRRYVQANVVMSVVHVQKALCVLNSNVTS